MSEAVTTPVVSVEEAKPVETAPPAEAPVPAAETPKPEEVVQLPVRLLFVYRFSSLRDPMQGRYQDGTGSSELSGVVFILMLTSRKESVAESTANPEPSTDATPTVTEDVKPVRTVPSLTSIYFDFVS